MKPKLKIIITMLIWGSMGVIVRNINLPSGEIALGRGMIGLLFLFVLCFLFKKKISISSIKKNKGLLITSGIVLGVEWIFLFEAFKHTSIAIATVVYYLAPIFITIMSHYVLKEKLSMIKIISSIAALIGLIVVSGIFDKSQKDLGNGIGILFAALAAIAYAGFTMFNKLTKNLDSMDSTMVQLGISCLVLIPYTIFAGKTTNITFEWRSLGFLIILGTMHTGLAFWLFFSSIKETNVQTVAVLSYLDPVTAIIVSAIVLNERLGVVEIVGVFIILGSAIVSELFENIRLTDRKRLYPVKRGA